MSYPEAGQRVRVKPDALSAWKGNTGTVVRVDDATRTATLALDKDILQITFWWDELEEA